MVHRFKYVGDPNDRFSGPDTAVHHGKTFRKNKVTDLSDKEEGIAKKLANHSHFLDMSDTEASKDVETRQKALEKADADKAKAEEEQRKKDEKDAAEMEKNRLAATEQPLAPRPPGNVTRDPTPDPFQGRTVEERTPTEDHTKAGKTGS